MFSKSLLRALLLKLAGIALTVAFVGCSSESPVAPIAPFSKAVTGPEDCPNCPQTALSARIATMDENTRMLTLEGHPDTIVALQNAEIVKFAANVEVRIQFGDLKIGDTITVNGQQQNSYVYAHRIRVEYTDPYCNYDLAFRDTITAIDYEAGSFMVAGRTETILVDENTYIWGSLYRGPNTQLSGGGDQNQYTERDRLKNMIDTVFQFTDLQVGDVVEVRAKIVDESTLLAVKIKLANCQDKECITFEAVIEAIDSNTRLVTFVGLDWEGMVCPKAELSDVDGTELTLADFVPGDPVFVKGFPTENALQICVMNKIEP